MKPKHIIPTLSILALLAASLACNLSNSNAPTATNPPSATETTAPAESPTATNAPAPVDPNSVSFSGVSFTIPNELGTLATSESVAAVDNADGPGWSTAPAYTKFTLQKYPIFDSMHNPEIRIYPAADYEKIHNGAAESLKRLRALTSSTGMDINNSTVPFIPYFNATQTFEAKGLLMKFQNGTGVRMVAQYDQAFIPVNNYELMYHFEGLTSDGNYYIIAIFPLNASILQADDKPDSPVPAGGVVFDFNKTDPATYYGAITQALNEAAPESFTPTLASLDALIQSIKITAP